MSAPLAEVPSPELTSGSLSLVQSEEVFIRRRAREIRLKQIELLTQGEAVEFLLACVEDLEVKLAASLPTRQGFYEKLTKIEASLLDKLLSMRGRVVDKEFLFNHIYSLRPSNVPEPKIIDIFICKLRKKLKSNGGPEILTSWGRGYFIERELEPKLVEKSSQSE